MCTLVLLHRPGHAWPLLLAANRDEMLGRPSLPPAAHWPEHPGIIGGRDTLAGGTWLALNAQGVVAGVLNRTGSLGPQAGKRSRGDLPLMALRHPTAQAAAAEAATWHGADWRSFNLIVADTTHAFFIRGDGQGPMLIQPLQPGLTMTTASDPNDPANPRTARHLPKFQQAPPPNPPDWKSWPNLLADDTGDWSASLNVPPTQGFGTTSAALLAVSPAHTEYLAANGRPGGVPFERVRLGK